MNLRLLLLACIFKLMQSKYYINPDVDVMGQCYYHTSTGLVNSCTDKNEVPNCHTTSVRQFSYEACDCNQSVHNVDTIVVIDQFPYSEPTIPNSKKASADSWRQSLHVLAAVFRPILGSSGTNTIGFIRPKATGCDFFGYTSKTFLRPAELLNATNYPWVDQGNCVPNSDPGTPNMICDRVQTKHMDCVKFARDVLAGRPRNRQKNIISIRHTNGNPSHPFVMKNEPSINLAYFVVTTSYAPLTSDMKASALAARPLPNFAQLCVDFTGFEKENNHFVHFTTYPAEIELLLNKNGRGGLPQGYLYCNDAKYLKFLSMPRFKAPPQMLTKRAKMICTLFPARPTLAWLPVQGLNRLDQNFIRRVTSAITSWLGGMKRRTGEECEKNGDCPGGDICCSTASGRKKKCQTIGKAYKNKCECRGPDQGMDCLSKKCSKGNKCDCMDNSDCGYKKPICCKVSRNGRKECVGLKQSKKRCQKTQKKSGSGSTDAASGDASKGDSKKPKKSKKSGKKGSKKGRKGSNGGHSGSS